MQNGDSPESTGTAEITQGGPNSTGPDEIGNAHQGTGEGSSSPGNDVQQQQEISYDASGKKDSEVKPKDQQAAPVLSRADKEKALDSYTSESVEAGIVSFNWLELVRVFPKAAEKCLNYMIEKSRMNVEEETAIGIVMYSPRNVFPEFFDSNKIYVNIISDENGFSNNMDTANIAQYTSRAYAEISAYKTAFAKLEEQLNNNK